MDHVCKSALTKELQEKSNGSVLERVNNDDSDFTSFCNTNKDGCFMCVCAAAVLQEQWEALAAKLSQTQQQIRACETAMVFAFVEVQTKKIT